MDLLIDITTNQTFFDLQNSSTVQNETSTIPTNLNESDDNFLNEFSVSHGPLRDPLYVVVPITLIYVLIFVTGVIGNISTCIVIAKNRSMHTATNYYLFSLAISDFLLLLSGAPQEVFFIWQKYPYIFGETFCVLRGLMAETSANATVLTITSFTVERYLAICHPFLQHTMSKLSRAVKFVIAIWIVSILLAIPQALQFGIVIDGYGIKYCQVIPERVLIEHSFELSTILFFLTPMTLITVLYILIGLKLRSSAMMKRENGVSIRRRTQTNSCRQQPSAGTRRMLKMLVAVVVAFFICWAPFHAQRLLAVYFIEYTGYDFFAGMTYFSGILYYLSTCINPLLYNIMSNKFREAFKETLAKFCQLSSRRNDEERTYRILSHAQRRHFSRQESNEYSGSSIRDESMHSTVTQKQSIDSMTATKDTRSSIINNKSATTSTIAIASPAITPSSITVIPKTHISASKLIRIKNGFKREPEERRLSRIRKINFDLFTQRYENGLRTPQSDTFNNDLNAIRDSKCFDSNRLNEKLFNSTIPYKTQNQSFLQNIFHWTSNATKTDNPSEMILPIDSCCYDSTKIPNENDITDECNQDSISGTERDGKRTDNISSITMGDSNDLKDELTMYMEEIRERERK